MQVVTFWEGEIVDMKNYTFFTGKWEATYVLSFFILEYQIWLLYINAYFPLVFKVFVLYIF